MENASQNGATPPPPTQITYQLNMSGTTHDLPAYEDETGSSVTTSYTTANGQPANVTTAIADYQYSSSANNSNVAMGTPVAYSTIQLDNTAMFSMSKSTEVTTTSPCIFVAGSTYYVTVEALGGVQQPTAAVDSFNPNTHTVTFPLLVSATSGNTFPANTTADIIISKTTP